MNKEPFSFDKSWKRFEKFDDILDKSNNEFIPIVLKSHLLIEEQLFNLVCKASVFPKGIEEASLGFYKLTLLAKAIYYEEHTSVIWDAIIKLNAIRNQLAHRLEPKDIENRILDFVNFIHPLPKEKTESTKDILAAFNQAIGFIYGYLSMAEKPK